MRPKIKLNNWSYTWGDWIVVGFFVLIEFALLGFVVFPDFEPVMEMSLRCNADNIVIVEPMKHQNIYLEKQKDIIRIYRYVNMGTVYVRLIAPLIGIAILFFFMIFIGVVEGSEYKEDFRILKLKFKALIMNKRVNDKLKLQRKLTNVFPKCENCQHFKCALIKPLHSEQFDDYYCEDFECII